MLPSQRSALSIARKRAIVLDPFGNLWGSERVLLDFLRTNIGSKWEFTVYCPGRTPLEQALTSLGIRVIPHFQRDLHHAGRLRRYGAAARLLATVMRIRPNILYVNQPGAAPYALVVGKLVGTPVVVHVRNPSDVPFMSKWLRRFPASDVVTVCVSNYVRNLFQGPEFDGGHRILTLYDLYTPHQTNRDMELRQPPVLPTFICVARLEPQKGQEILLEALACLRADGIQCRAEFVGIGREGSDHGSRLQNIATDMKVDDAVEWLGELESPIDLIAASSALVLPASNEALGRVVFEAWDAGTIPVVWRGSGGPAEVVEASGGGLLYEFQTGESLARTLKVALTLSPEERSSRIALGKKWLRSNTDSARYAQAMDDIFETRNTNQSFQAGPPE